MPYKYPEKKGWEVPKQKHKVSNGSEYTEALRQCGSIDVWVSTDIIDRWYEPDSNGLH